jgi:HK97 gp10 family phage protein
MIRVRFEGGAELAAALESLPKRVGRSMLVEALTDAAEPMRKRMASLAPREPGAPDMADNIIVSRSMVTIQGDGEKVRNDEFQASVAVGPSKGFFYGFFQEFGTTRHSAQPFARPAFDSESQAALDLLARSLWTALAARGISRSVTVNTPVRSGGGSGLL